MYHHILSLPNKLSANCAFQFGLEEKMDCAWDMYAGKFNHDRNALKYEKLYWKLGVVCTGISQNILVYAGDKVNGLHIVFFNFDYMIRSKMRGRCMHAYLNIRKLPSNMKHLGVIVSIYPGIYWDIQG
jgi:hypothetical protein